jgi:hypothetical protein
MRLQIEIAENVAIDRTSAKSPPIARSSNRTIRCDWGFKV